MFRLGGASRCYRGAGVEDILLVSGFHAAEVEAAARGLGLAVVRNPRPEEGMFSSACAGLRAVPEDWRRLFRASGGRASGPLSDPGGAAGRGGK